MCGVGWVGVLVCLHGLPVSAAHSSTHSQHLTLSQHLSQHTHALLHIRTLTSLPSSSRCHHPMQGANVMHPSLLLTVSANANALRADPVQAINDTQPCSDGATCIRQSDMGVVLVSEARTPRMLRYVHSGPLEVGVSLIVCDLSCCIVR